MSFNVKNHKEKIKNILLKHAEEFILFLFNLEI